MLRRQKPATPLVSRSARTASAEIEGAVATEHPARGASAPERLPRRFSQSRRTRQSGHHGPTQEASSRLSPEWRLTPFALVNPYAGTFGPETIAAGKFPLPFGHSSRPGFALQISLLLRCAASLRPLGRGSGPPAPSWPGFIATGSQPQLQGERL